jgi:hypothetical protein
VLVTDTFGTVDTLERVEPAKPTVDQLNGLVGTYTSDEIETSLTVALDGNALVIKRRPDTVTKLTPLFADAFSSDAFDLVIFRRDAAGRVNALSVVESRVWDLRFVRQPMSSATSQH